MKPKDPLIAVLLSLIYAGLGQVYAGANKRGILFLSLITAITTVAIGYVVSPSTKLFFWLLLPAVFLVAFEIFIIIDAYRCAVKYNSANGLVRSRTQGRQSAPIIGIFFLFFVFNPTHLVTVYVKTYLVRAYKVPTESMAPALLIGDRILVDKQIYRREEPERGDIVVFLLPDQPSKASIKRLVALPGDTLEIKDGHLFVNGDRLNQGPFGKITYSSRGLYGEKWSPVVVPPDHYYLLGDNSSNSRDSRYIGFIPRKSLIGKAYKIYFPFDRSVPLQ